MRYLIKTTLKWRQRIKCALCSTNWWAHHEMVRRFCCCCFYFFKLLAQWLKLSTKWHLIWLGSKFYFHVVLFFIFWFLGENDRAALKFSDPKVCKSFLLECCPHEILASTVSVKIFDEHFEFSFQLWFISFHLR